MRKDERLAFNKLCDDLKLIRWQKLSNSALAQLYRTVKYASHKVEGELTRRGNYYERGSGMNKEERLAKVWERRYQVVTTYRSLEDDLKVRTGYDLAKLNKLLKEYDLTVEDFQEYGRRMKGGVSG